MAWKKYYRKRKYQKYKKAYRKRKGSYKKKGRAGFRFSDFVPKQSGGFRMPSNTSGWKNTHGHSYANQGGINYSDN